VGDDYPEHSHRRFIEHGVAVWLQIHPLLHLAAEGDLHRALGHDRVSASDHLLIED
jgi:hypothetical protein